MLPAKFQHLITGEINRILREMNRPAGDEKNREETRQWHSLSRLESTLGRDSLVGSETQISLSRKGSAVEMGGLSEFEDFPMRGTSC